MKTYYAVIKLRTEEKFQFIDLTDKIKKIIQHSGIANGLINIVSRHTTTAILLNENEPLLLNDFQKELRRLFPQESTPNRYFPTYYKHDDIEERRKFNSQLSCDECKNGDSHCRSIFLTNSQTLNVIDGKLELGRWQSIIFWELDIGKDREISVMVIGEEKKNPSSNEVAGY